MNEIKKEWFGNTKQDILSGMVVAIALIPEAIGFSIIAGVNPMMGLYASFCIAMITAFFGGRQGMISAATGAMALLLVNLVKDYGIEYMLAATILTGIIQLILGYLKIGNLLKFIPRPVMIGFVNALAILIFKAQLPYFQGESIWIYALVAIGLLVIYLFPKINKTIPSPLIAIIAVTVLASVLGIKTTTIGDIGNISSTLPKFLIPNVSVSLETLKIILPYSISLSIVGLVESLLTAQLLDDLTHTKSNKNRECMGQGVANVVSGLFGGMAGCAMIGQSIINFKSGGRGRLSTFVAGLFLMILIILLNKFVVIIPIAALISVMIVVSISTFDWESLKRLKIVPKTDSIVMISTVVVVLFTHNLAFGVIVGVILSALFFASKISEVHVEKFEKSNVVEYKVSGQLFFSSTTSFINHFSFEEKSKTINIDLSNVRIWDESAVDCIDKLVFRFRKNDNNVNLVGMSTKCKEIIEQIGKHDKIECLDSIGH
ncbi:SulP family inorganic anion transporter [Paraclostridium sp. AKS73]|uniref:SulP family inorganic anion transporter n=1 Tax=Paraclostridium sp. AKS73 TaxID=2876116 RepID=UPI0021E0C3A1|nr:SulP family inorganic anion transporter [Paraclostridium sp. AKS73]MCU9816852.1 SulP family inorganic anion transporter [Paraclostridium sp. AKS73]